MTVASKEMRSIREEVSEHVYLKSLLSDVSRRTFVVLMCGDSNPEDVTSSGCLDSYQIALI